jgi:hypothetical protein
VRQQVRRVTGWTLPEIDRLSYVEVLDVLLYETEARRRENERR